MKEASSVPCQGCGVFVRQDRLLHKCYNTMTVALLPWTAAVARKHHSQVQPSPLIAVFNSLNLKPCYPPGTTVYRLVASVIKRALLNFRQLIDHYGHQQNLST